MADQLLAPTFLFRISVDLYRCPKQWPPKKPLPEKCRLPMLGELEGKQSYADLRGGWNEAGLYFSLVVTGKKKKPKRSAGPLERSDGLQLWIDTRATQNVHRASRFCHRLLFLPGGGKDNPIASLLFINRAKGQPKPPASDAMKVAATVKPTGYQMHVHLPATCLTGFQPEDQNRLGFNYLITDHELGDETLAIGREFPIEEDPSLWGVLNLV